MTFVVFLGWLAIIVVSVKKISDVVVPLISWTSVSRVFEWSPSCMKAFQSAKVVLCSTLVLAAPSFDRPFNLEVDASASRACAVLLQEDHPVCYF